MYYPCKRDNSWHVVDSETGKTVSRSYPDRMQVENAIRTGDFQQQRKRLAALEMVFDESDLEGVFNED